MAASDPEAFDGDVEGLDEEEPKKTSSVEFHMSKLEALDHSDVLEKIRMVKKVTALLRAQKSGKVHPEKVERRKTPIVEEVKAVHTEEDERDEAWENLSAFAIPLFRRGRQSLVTTQMLQHDTTNEVTVVVTVPVTLQPGDPFMVSKSNGVVVPNVPWSDMKWLDAAKELHDTIVVPGTSFRYRVPVFNKAVVPKPLFGKDKKVKTDLPLLGEEDLHDRMDATVQAFKDANKRSALLERRRCRLVCTSTLRFFLALVMAVLVLAATSGMAIFHGQYYTDWLLRLMLYNIVPAANSTQVESIFDAPLGSRTHQKVENGSYVATVMDGVCTKEGRAWQSYFNILALDPEWPGKFQTCFGKDGFQVPVLESDPYNVTMYGIGADLINVTLPQDFWSQWHRIMVHNNVFLFVLHWIAFVCGVTTLGVYIVSGSCFVCCESLRLKQWSRVRNDFANLYIMCMEDVTRNTDRCAEIAQGVVDGEGGDELLAVRTKRRALGCLPGYRWLTMTLLLLIEYFFDFAALGCCIYVVLVLFGPVSQGLGAGLVQGFYVLAVVVLAFVITVEREPAEGQPPCFKHPEIMRKRKPHEDAVIGCCSSTRSRVQRWMVLPALVTCLVCGTAIASVLLFLSNGLDDKLAMLMLVATLAIGVLQATVRACSFRAHLSQDLPFWWPVVYCCLRPGTHRFLRERILLSYYISRARKVTKPFQDDIQVLLTDYGKGDWQPRWDVVTVSEVNEELQPGYEDNDGLDENDREVIHKLGYNDPRRISYFKAAEQRVADARSTLLRVGAAKRYQPVPTLKELGREIDMRFKPMFGAGAASKLTSYVSCTVQFDNARELAGFAAYLKGYAFADPGSSQSLMRFVGVNNRFVKQGLTEESRKQQRCLPLRFLAPKWYSWWWRQQQIEEQGATPELGEGFDTLEYMPQEGFSDVTCYIRYRGLICEVRLVIRSMQIHRNQVREHLKVTRCRSADEFVADIVDDWTAKEVWDEVPPPHLQPCVKNYKYCKCCKCVRNDALQLLMCALWWGVLVGALISGALLFPPSAREVLQWCEKPEGEHYTEFMSCHSWLPFFCTPGVLANTTNWAASYSDIYYGQPQLCETLCLSPYAGEYYEDTHTWICNTPSVDKQVSYNTTDPAATTGTTAKVCRAIEIHLGDTHCDEADNYNTRVCGWDNGDCCEHLCGKLKPLAKGQRNECGTLPWSCKGFTTPTPKREKLPCKAIAAGETALLDNTVCDRKYNVFDCDWDGGDCCAITCGWDRTPDSRGGCDEDGAFDCRDPNPAIPTPPPPNVTILPNMTNTTNVTSTSR